MEQLIEILRIFILAQITTILVLVIQSRKSFQFVKPMVLYLICTMSYLVLDINGLKETPLFYPLLFINFLLPFNFFLLSKSLFDDDFQWKNSYWLWMFLTASTIYLTNFHDCEYCFDFSQDVKTTLQLIPFGLTISFVVLAIVEAAKNQSEDLIISRLQFRTLFITLSSIIIVTTVLAEIAFLQGEIPKQLDLVQKIFIATLTLYFMGSQASLNMGFLRGNQTNTQLNFDQILQQQYPKQKHEKQVENIQPPAIQTPNIVPSPPKTNLESTATEAEKAQKKLKNPIIVQLLQLMEEEKYYQTEGLTIPQLAAKIGIKEYKLRQTINQELGFRNFNAFLNSYRIRAACQILSDPSNDALTILEIAYNMGYQSLAPFNKAFKQITGMTPTEWRKQAH